jgi:hypothetical protein
MSPSQARSLSTMVREVKAANTIVSGPYREWLGKHADEPMPEWVIEKIAMQLRTKPRDRSASFSASSGGQCLRRRELAFLGVRPAINRSPDSTLRNIFQDGKWRHLRWQASCLAAGIFTDIEVPLVWPNMRHRGTVDGVGLVPDSHPFPEWRGKTFGVELKGMNRWHYDRFVRLRDTQKDEHKGQVDEYFLSSGWDLFVFLYEDKATGQFKEWVVAPERRRLRDAKHDLELMNKDIDNKQLRPMLPSCQIRQGDNWKGCPFAGAHGPCERIGDWPA